LENQYIEWFGAMKRYLSADEADDLLGASKAALYAYVSPGPICSDAWTHRIRRHYLLKMCSVG
jgi:hypothetical protein